MSKNLFKDLYCSDDEEFIEVKPKKSNHKLEENKIEVTSEVESNN